MIVDIILAGILFYLMFPTITGYAAHNYGRSFWLWFTIGLFLPVISYLVLVAMIFWDERKTSEPRLTRRERVNSDKLVKGLLEETGTISAPKLKSAAKELKD